MNYIFMDNFRGFNETIIPLRHATFLVGENSTGKSSFLSLLYLFSMPEFWLEPDFSPRDFLNFGGFKDIISAGSPNKEHFTIGLFSNRTKDTEKDTVEEEFTFTMMTFQNDEGIPRLHRCINYMDKKMVEILFMPKTTRYKVHERDIQAADEEGLFSLILDIFYNYLSDTKGFKAFPKDIPPHQPLAIALTMLQQELKLTKKREPLLKGIFPTFTRLLPAITNLTWLSPIRTKPQRIYDGFKTKFSPEGAHTPHIIRKTLRSGEAKRFVTLLSKFGNSSGLFENVKTHSFSKDHAGPFEVMIELFDEALNINNVGYGVSQVLPVVVDMFTSPKRHWFAIQQPEIHLHPRAQAALGDVIHFLITEKNHYYIIETHSDFLIDRFRLCIREKGFPKDSQVIYFERIPSGNKAHALIINEKGQYPEHQPKGFRNFFIHEEMKLLDI